MAKKKSRSRNNRPAKTAKSSSSRQQQLAGLGVEDTVELVEDVQNPRAITGKAERGLRNSLARFGDLSGLVFNRRTEQLVCGHQRMKQIREEYGDLPIETLDAEAELGIIRVNERHAFTVRIVDWSLAMQRAANVAANNQKLAGVFTDDLSAYLIEVQADISEEMPTALDELLLADYLEATAGETQNADIAERYQVVVECESVEQQEEVHELLNKKGWKCRVLTV